MNKDSFDGPFVLVVAIELNDAGAFAFDQAARIVRTIPSGQLQVVHVTGAKTPPARIHDLSMQLRQYVREKSSSLVGLIGHVGVHVRTGEIAQEIAQFATDVNASLVIVGTHKAPQLKSLFVGSVASHVMALTICPVLVAGPKPEVSGQTTTIIPACADCVRTRFESKGVQWWCDRHSEHHVGGHVYSYQEAYPFETHDSEFIPTGVDV